MRPFAAALEREATAGRYGLIAEIKKASPSRGLIRADFDPATLAPRLSGRRRHLPFGADRHALFPGRRRTPPGRARRLQPAGAAQGFHPRPLSGLESRALGGDCILLIMAALEDAEARDLAAIAAGLGLDVLVEVHDRAELDRALRLNVRLIGINNRNLKTLKVDLHTTESLAPSVPPGRLIVGESGIYDPADLDRLAAAGARCFLVGELLMREKRCRRRDTPPAAPARPDAYRRRGPRPHGRCLGQGRDRPNRHRRRARRDAARDPGAHPGRRCRQGRCAGGRARRRHHGREAHPRPDPAVPPAGADLGFGRADLRAGDSRRSRSPRPAASTAAPASRWRH